MTDSQDRLLDHDYDGIQELDNNLPRWWLLLFYLSIIWGVIYFVYYDVLEIGYSSTEEYKAEINPNFVRASASEAKLLGIVKQYHSPFYSIHKDQTPRSIALGGGKSLFVLETRESDTVTYVALTEPSDLNTGHEIFLTNCATCHGKLGEGGVGPNLTDQYWLHGNEMTNIVKSIKYGYPAQGMISWRGYLKPEQMVQVASFVKTLAGTNPPKQKAPQGELVE